MGLPTLGGDLSVGGVDIGFVAQKELRQPLLAVLIQGFGFWILGLGFGVWDSGFRVWGLNVGVWSVGFRV